MFYTWIDSPVAGTNVLDSVTYSSDSQRTNGFQSGTVASSIRVNTALRQSTLVTAALMSAMGLDTMSSYLDSLSSIVTKISTFFGSLTVTPNPVTTDEDTILSGLTINNTNYRIVGGGGTTVVPNPSPAGTTDLKGLGINGTNYKCADPSVVASNTNAISGLSGSLITLQATVGGLTPTPGSGNITKNDNIVGTYSYYKVNKVVMFKFNTYTASGSIDIGVNLTNFPSTNFDATNCPFTYIDGDGLAHCGRVRISVSDSTILIMCNDESGRYVDTTIKNALGTWFTIILN